ncbi:MAG TPA: hypothetical protein PKL88_02645, partial [bacterium]|nr:hypothetical protein [bacterium]
MSMFSYTAKNNIGGTVSGDVEARNREIAVSLLKNQGFTVISIKEKSSDVSDFFSDLRGVPFGEVVTFT